MRVNSDLDVDVWHRGSFRGAMTPLKNLWSRQVARADILESRLGTYESAAKLASTLCEYTRMGRSSWADQP